MSLVIDASLAVAWYFDDEMTPATQGSRLPGLATPAAIEG